MEYEQRELRVCEQVTEQTAYDFILYGRPQQSRLECACPAAARLHSPAGSTLKRPVPLMALGTRWNSMALAIALTDELKNNLYFFSEAQRLNFNGFRLLIWTFICSYAYFKLNLKRK